MVIFLCQVRIFITIHMFIGRPISICSILLECEYKKSFASLHVDEQSASCLEIYKCGSPWTRTMDLSLIRTAL